MAGICPPRAGQVGAVRADISRDPAALAGRIAETPVPKPSSNATSQTPGPLPSAEWATWHRLVQIYLSRDTESAEIRARLVQWMTFVSPWLMGVNILSATVLALLLPVAVASWLRWAWSPAAASC